MHKRHSQLMYKYELYRYGYVVQDTGSCATQVTHTHTIAT